MMVAVYLLVVIVAISEARLPLPKEIQACNRSDPNLNACFEKNGNLAMRFIAKGVPEYNISSLLPLKWKNLFVLGIPPLTLSLLDVVVYGAENFTIKDPQLVWKSKYVATIDMLGMHHDISGDANIAFYNGKWNMTFPYERKRIDGVEYANITKPYAGFISGDLGFDMGDLDTNPLFQTAWNNVKKMFIGEHIESCAGQTVGDVFNDILNNVPLHEVFIP